MSSLSSAMMSALSGLRSTQAGMEVVSNNVANAGSANYSRRVLLNSQQVIGNNTVGVRAGEVNRALDLIAQRQLWTETGGGAYTATRANYMSQLENVFGAPGDSSSLEGLFNTFTQSLQTLTSSPDSTAARSEVIGNAQVLAQQLNAATTSIQQLRSAAERSISSVVDDINAALQGIEKYSTQIDRQGTANAAALLDQRDGYISQLSALIDIKVIQDGNKVSIFTNAGALLFDGQAARLEFNESGDLNARALYDPDPAKSGTGAITLIGSGGSRTDMVASGLIRSGELAGLVELRDKTLVQAQTQLDELAAQMATALSNRQVQGTVASSGAQTGFTIDLTGNQLGNPLTIATTNGGVARQTMFVEVAAGTPLPLSQAMAGGSPAVKVVGYSGGAAGAAAAISSELGAGFTVSASGNSVTVLDDGAGGTTDVTAMSASITSTSLTGDGPEIPLFVDTSGYYTGALDGQPQRRGFAGRISVNPQVLANPATLVQYAPGVPSGDTTRPRLILDRLTSSQFAMPPDTGVGGTVQGYVGTVGSFARAIVQTQARNIQTAQNVDDGQQIVVNSLTEKLKATSGVNMDTEMSNLLALQNAYGANARVMSTIKEMLDTLMRM